MYGSGEYVGITWLLLKIIKSSSLPSYLAEYSDDSDMVVVDSVVVVVVDSMMELELPGEEKKKRWEVKAVMKSTAT